MAGYGTDSDFTAWLAAEGLTLPDDAAASAVLRQRGSNYVDSVYAARLYCSAPTGGVSQERAWPRTGHSFPVAIDSDVIPGAWERASYRAAYLDATRAGGLSKTVDPDKRVKRQKVDDIEREFFNNGESEAGASGAAILDAEIDGMLAPFLCPKDAASMGLWSLGS